MYFIELFPGVCRPLGQTKLNFLLPLSLHHVILLAKIKNWPSKFPQISFQSSNFTFVHFSPLSFKFIQLKPFCQLLLKIFEKNNLENIFQSLIDFF